MSGMVSNAAPSREALAEGLGTAFLLMMIVGSGIMGERLSAGSAILALLANSLATGAGLTALILAFSPLSAADFNPLVTLVSGVNSRIPIRMMVEKTVLQFIGAYVGVMTAHLMFGERLISAYGQIRGGGGQILGEFIATLGLVFVILSCSRSQSQYTAFAVGAYITAAYWFTSSTSFANPAVTFARSFTGTFSGIRFEDAPRFVLAQVSGAGVGWLLFRCLYRATGRPPTEAGDQVERYRRLPGEIQ